MKRLNLVIFLAITFLLVLNVAVSAEDAIKINLDGKIISTDTSPIVVDSRVLVPVRVVSENLGYYVFWDAKTREVYLTKDNLKIRFNINQTKIWKNDVESQLDVPPVIKNGRVFLPIRVISESVGALVDWDGKTKTVLIQTKVIKTTTSSKNDDSDSATLDAISQDGTSITLNLGGNGLWEPNMFTLKEPDRLVIDINRAVLSKQFKEPIVQDNDVIESIRYSQYQLNPNQVRIVVVLKKKADYTYKLDNNSITINFISHVYKVVIDPGHGGKDPGAIGITGKREKDLNLAVGLKVASLLNNVPGVEVILTRDTDEFISLDQRVNIANNANADIFISIHTNALPYHPSIYGSETYFDRSESASLAQVMHKYLVQSTGFTDRGIRTAGYRVIKYTNMPAVLLEMGYLTNSYEEKTMFTSSFQDRVSLGIVNGIEQYLGIK